MHYTIRISVDARGRNFTATCPQLRGWYYLFHIDESRDEVLEGVRDSIARFRYPEPAIADEEIASFKLRIYAEELMTRARSQYEEYARMRVD